MGKLPVNRYLWYTSTATYIIARLNAPLLRPKSDPILDDVKRASHILAPSIVALLLAGKNEKASAATSLIDVSVWSWEDTKEQWRGWRQHVVDIP